MSELFNIDNQSPSIRRLRAYPFDPSLSMKLETSAINNITYKIDWEYLRPGPVGEYIEVVDYDPSSGCFYAPVNLNAIYALVQDGLDPSVLNPQFHQQMVYAVSMYTIKNFEKALGRKIQWSSYYGKGGNSSYFVERLRIYPHALREANAYYSPQKKALLFGYFNATSANPGVIKPGSTVFTCLSHDIIAHEITHALLDGMHQRYIEVTHPDSLAFHEAFADIVALFQHFTFPEVLKDQIARTRGDLASQNLLGQLAQEFGRAIGRRGSLRDSLGGFNEVTGEWEPYKPDPAAYETVTEPHERGSILVAAVFEAFNIIYKWRVGDLLRLATGGSGILPPGALHPDLINRLAQEASKVAGHILKMCIRALDYCPAIDINFGDYLRALITADHDLVEEDHHDYRLAFIEAFQKRGIYPDNVQYMGVENLLYKLDLSIGEFEARFEEKFGVLLEFFRLFKEKVSYVTDRKELYYLTKLFITGGELPSRSGRIMGLHQRLNVKFMGKDAAKMFGDLTGLLLDDNFIEEQGIGRSKASNTFGAPKIEVHNLKLASRVGPDGNVVNQILVTLTQRRGVICETDRRGNVVIKGFFVPDAPEKGWHEYSSDKRNPYIKRPFPERNEKDGREKLLPKGWFIFRGASTLIFDLNDATEKNNVKLKYIIKKDIRDTVRMKRQYAMLFNNQEFSLHATYFGTNASDLGEEPFALIHKAL